MTDSESPEPTSVIVLVPAIVGTDLDAAMKELERAGLAVVVTEEFSRKPPGTVLDQSVQRGSEVEEGTTVSLVVAKPIPEVPSVVGMSQSAATKRLKRLDYLVVVKKKGTSSVSAGKVISQSPAAGSPLAPAEEVTIVVAKAPPPTPSNCTSGYSPCLPSGPSDYDRYGGSGDGPAYTAPGVRYRVSGSDPYGLDSDNDGYGCE